MKKSPELIPRGFILTYLKLTIRIILRFSDPLLEILHVLQS